MSPWISKHYICIPNSINSAPPQNHKFYYAHCKRDSFNQSPKFYDNIFLFFGLTTLETLRNFNWLSFQTFQPLTLFYRRCNFVYHHWGCTSIYRPLSFPFRSVCSFIQCSIITVKNNFDFIYPHRKNDLDNDNINIISNMWKSFFCDIKGTLNKVKLSYISLNIS